MYCTVPTLVSTNAGNCSLRTAHDGRTRSGSSTRREQRDREGTWRGIGRRVVCETCEAAVRRTNVRVRATKIRKFQYLCVDINRCRTLAFKRCTCTRGGPSRTRPGRIYRLWVQSCRRGELGRCTLCVVDCTLLCSPSAVSFGGRGYEGAHGNGESFGEIGESSWNILWVRPWGNTSFQS